MSLSLCVALTLIRDEYCQYRWSPATCTVQGWVGVGGVLQYKIHTGISQTYYEIKKVKYLNNDLL